MTDCSAKVQKALEKYFRDKESAEEAVNNEILRLDKDVKDLALTDPKVEDIKNLINHNNDILNEVEDLNKKKDESEEELI